MKTDILYEDGDILVVYKPAGLGVQTAKMGQQDVVSELKNYLRQNRQQQRHSQAVEASVPYLGIIHRLDQPVEGLLVFAKNKKAAAALSKQLQEQGNGGTLHKQYYVVLCGKPATKEGELVDYLYKNKENMAEVAAGQGVQGAKRAVLRYRVLQVSDIKNLSETAIVEAVGIQLVLADIHIQTGRFHQIRAQMAHAGTPLLGDLKYGNEETNALSKKLKMQHVALCAYSLAFLHPVSKKKMRFQIEPRGSAFSFFHMNEF